VVRSPALIEDLGIKHVVFRRNLSDETEVTSRGYERMVKFIFELLRKPTTVFSGLVICEGSKSESDLV
jgi:hypothetical protein